MGKERWSNKQTKPSRSNVGTRQLGRSVGTS